MKKIVSALALTLAAALPAASQAAAYNFDVLYSGGGVAALQPGSDNPTATNLQPGDTFTWRISAEGTEFWRVVTGGGFFPLMAFGMTTIANPRVGNFDLSLKLDGTANFVTSELGTENSFFHLGTNTIDLPTGLEFDEMVLSYSFTSSTAQDNIPTGLLPIFGAPEQNTFFPGIEYIQVQVPEPVSLALLGAGLAALGALRRRRD